MFDIYSIGDSAFLAQILNAVAMICGTGDFVQLVSIGLIIGLIIICVQSIMGGVRELSLQHLLMGWIMYACFFGPSVTVTIEDAYTGQVRVVDNVPLGVGFSGSLISNIGYGVTVLFEQGYQNVATITNEPFAESLRELQAVRRNLDNPKVMQAINDTLAPNSDVSRSLHNYLRECTMMKLANGAISLDELRTESWAEAIRFESQVFGTRLYLNGAQDLTCSAAWAPLSNALNQINAGAVIQEINRAIGVVDNNGQYPQHTDSIDAALNQLGNVSTDVQDFIKASIIEPIYQRAAQSYYTDYHDVAAATMVSQALNQRNTQWAAEQSMFMTTVRPILTFFEGFIYAITPLMGFLFVIGQFGIRLAMRYFQTVIWIQLWMPVMSICNLYIIMAARSEMASLGASRLDSFYALNRMDDLVSTWLATGGMLCTATPIIALFLVTGSTYAFTTLANRLGGGDHINEKVASPDALAVGAVHSQGAWQSGDSFGMQRTGSEGMFQRIDFGSAASASAVSAQQRVDQVTNSFTDSLAQSIRNGKGFNIDDNFTTGFKDELAASHSTGLKAAYGKVKDWATSHGLSESQAEQLATQTVLQGGLNGQLGKAFLGISGGFTARSTDGNTTTTTNEAKKLAKELDSIGLTRDDSAEMKKMVGNTINNEHGEKYLQSIAEDKTSSLQQAAQNVLSARSSYQEADAKLDSMAALGSMREDQFANYAFAEASRNGTMGSFESALGNYLANMSSAERNLFDQRYDSLMKTGYSPMGDTTHMGMKAAALIGTLIRSGKYEEASALIGSATGISTRGDFNPGRNDDIGYAQRAQGHIDGRPKGLPSDWNDKRAGIFETADQGRGAVDGFFGNANRRIESDWNDSERAKAMEHMDGAIAQLSATETPTMQKSLPAHDYADLREWGAAAGLTKAQNAVFESYGLGWGKPYGGNEAALSKVREDLYQENLARYGNGSNEAQVRQLTDSMVHALGQTAMGKEDQMSNRLGIIAAQNKGLLH